MNYEPTIPDIKVDFSNDAKNSIFSIDIADVHIDINYASETLFYDSNSRISIRTYKNIVMELSKSCDENTLHINCDGSLLKIKFKIKYKNKIIELIKAYRDAHKKSTENAGVAL